VARAGCAGVEGGGRAARQGSAIAAAQRPDGIVVGGSLGIILVLLERWLPRYKKFIPSPTGLGLSFTINGFNSVSFFIGSVIAVLLRKLKPEWDRKYRVAASSGVIAGERA